MDFYLTLGRKKKLNLKNFLLFFSSRFIYIFPAVFYLKTFSRHSFATSLCFSLLHRCDGKFSRKTKEKKKIFFSTRLITISLSSFILDALYVCGLEKNEREKESKFRCTHVEISTCTTGKCRMYF